MGRRGIFQSPFGYVRPNIQNGTGCTLPTIVVSQQNNSQFSLLSKAPKDRCLGQAIHSLPNIRVTSVALSGKLGTLTVNSQI